MFFVQSCGKKTEHIEKSANFAEKALNNDFFTEGDFAYYHRDVNNYDMSFRIEVNENEYLLAQQGEYDDTKYGIYSADGEEIVPVEFDTIALMPTYDGCWEVTKDDKVGLYSSDGIQILPPVYDDFFPVYEDGVKAYFKKDNRYGYIASDGNEHSKYELSPFENGTIEQWDDNISTVFVDEEYENYIASYPSFYRHFFYDDIQDVDGMEAWVIEKEFDTFWEHTYLSFVYKKAGGYIFLRQADENNYTLYYITSDNHRIFYRAQMSDRVTDFNYFDYSFINDTILRVIYNNYDFMHPVFSYFLFKDGKCIYLSSNRKYPFTKYEKITEDLLKNTYSDGEKHESGDIIGTFSYDITKYPCADELDLMRNEIFADYGYIFKSEKWEKYFKDKSWYNPRFDNVDDKLSELEKENIDFILNFKNQLDTSKCHKEEVFDNCAG